MVRAIKLQQRIAKVVVLVVWQTVKAAKVTNRARRALVDISSKKLVNLTTIRPTKITTSSYPTMTNPSCTAVPPQTLHNNNCRIRMGVTVKTPLPASTVAGERISLSHNLTNKPATMTTQIINMSSNMKAESNIRIEVVICATLTTSSRMTRTTKMVLMMLPLRCRRCSLRCLRLGIIWERRITAHSILPGQTTTAPST